MKNDSQARSYFRPHGFTSMACRECSFFEECGGIQTYDALFSKCYDRCDHICSQCDNVCPKNKDFYMRICEINGIRFDNIKNNIKQEITKLPYYIPKIHHGSRRSLPLNVNIVAIGLHDLFSVIQEKMCLKVDSMDDLKQKYKLDKDTKIILSGVAEDNKIETYWSYRKRDGIPFQLARLKPDYVIGPNFSHFLDVPRTDNLFNRKRQIICLEEMADHGISVIPHLNAITDHDWSFWKQYICTNRLKYVAVEFQTGNKNRIEGLKTIQQLKDISDTAKLPLHPIFIGAFQYLTMISGYFNEFTLIDSKPFMCGVFRHSIEYSKNMIKVKPSHTLEGFPIDDIIDKNIQKHRTVVEKLATKGKKVG